MKVKIEQNENGEHYFLIPDDLQRELSWNEGDLIEWIDNGDGSWILKKLSKLDVLLENYPINEPMDSEQKDWLDAKPVGKEII